MGWGRWLCGCGEPADPPPPPPRPGARARSGSARQVTSQDPNSLDGPAGYGQDNFVSDTSQLPYQINFENDPTATAPAQQLTSPTHSIPTWTGAHSSLRPSASATRTSPSTRPAALRHDREDDRKRSDVRGRRQPQPGPGHGDLHGLLPVDRSLHEPAAREPLDRLPAPRRRHRPRNRLRQLHHQPNAGLATGTQIRNVALVTFDLDQPIATDQVNDEDPSQGHRPDQASPRSRSTPARPPAASPPLPATEASTSFTVSWSGQDDPGGSGIAFYNIYVSEDGGPFTLWQTDTTQTSATFTGHHGHTYGFYSVATDNVGNVQATPTAAQARRRHILAVIDTTISVQSCEPGRQPAIGSRSPRPWARELPVHPMPTGSVQFLIDGVDLGAPVSLVDGTARRGSVVNLSIANHVVTAQYQSDDVTFNSGQGTLSGGEMVNRKRVGRRGHEPGVAVRSIGDVHSNNRRRQGGLVGTGRNGAIRGRRQTVRCPVNVVDREAVSIQHVLDARPGATRSPPSTRVTPTSPPIQAHSPRRSHAPLTIEVNNESRLVGQPNPPFTVSYFGFVNGDGPSSLLSPRLALNQRHDEQPCRRVPDHSERRLVTELHHHLHRRHADSDLPAL